MFLKYRRKKVQLHNILFARQWTRNKAKKGRPQTRAAVGLCGKGLHQHQCLLFTIRRENKRLVLRCFRIVDVALSWLKDGETAYP